MININNLYQKVQQLSNKYQGSGYLPPNEFNRYVNMASLELLTQWFNVYQNTQRITDDIRRFIVTDKLPIDDYGRVEYPDDYIYFIALRTYNQKEYDEIKENCNGTAVDYANISQVGVKLIDNDKLGNRMSSDLLRPTIEYPVGTMYSDYIQIYPTMLGMVQLDYLKKPQQAKWGYVTDVSGLPIYNAATSVDLDWHDSVGNKIIMKVCKYFGIEVRDAELTNAIAQTDKEN